MTTHSNAWGQSPAQAKRIRKQIKDAKKQEAALKRTRKALERKV